MGEVITAIPKRAYNLKQTAAILDISYHSLRALIDAGAIRPIFLPQPKVTDVEIDKFIRNVQKDGEKYKELLEENNRRVSAKKPVSKEDTIETLEVVR
jgi:predicted site-specific integrase-resolvase